MKLSRQIIRELAVGDSITLVCENMYDFFCKRSTAYTVGQLEGRRFSCSKTDGPDGLSLTIRRTA